MQNKKALASDFSESAFFFLVLKKIKVIRKVPRSISCLEISSLAFNNLGWKKRFWCISDAGKYQLLNKFHPSTGKNDLCSEKARIKINALMPNCLLLGSTDWRMMIFLAKPISIKLPMPSSVIWKTMIVKVKKYFYYIPKPFSCYVA